jgi:tRNA-specific 2-thiouridylase
MNINSLGFPKSPADTKVVVAMSGGVDSSVVAALLHDQGYDVIGVTLQLYDHGVAVGKKGACCAGQDIADARAVADGLGIPYYVLDYENQFRQEVIDDFADSYIRGETPIPCVRCNQTVKFRDLLKVAHDLGANALATGHYIQRTVTDQGQAELHRGFDTTKDQSYFLFATTQEQLDFLRFPLGHQTKDQTRELAQKYGLALHDKPDSQDICFVAKGHYSDLVQKLRPDAATPGEIRHIDGRVLGTHKGILHYTIGQRKGLGIGGFPDPLYVIKIDPLKHVVVLGPYEALGQTTLWLDNVNLLVPQSYFDNPITVKVRSVQKDGYPARLQFDGDTTKVELQTPASGLSPGQACVFYDDTRLLGGGWIKRAPTE